MALELSFEIISRRIEEEVIVIDDDDDDDDDDDADSFFPVSPIRPAFIEELSESEEEEDSAIERSRPPSVIDLTIMEDETKLNRQLNRPRERCQWRLVLFLFVRSSFFEF